MPGTCRGIVQVFGRPCLNTQLSSVCWVAIDRARWLPPPCGASQ